MVMEMTANKNNPDNNNYCTKFAKKSFENQYHITEILTRGGRGSFAFWGQSSNGSYHSLCVLELSLIALCLCKWMIWHCPHRKQFRRIAGCV